MASLAAGLSHRALLALQRASGNAKVARLLKAGPGRLQRFVGPEHESLGNVTGAEIDLGNGVVLTWGQVVAIAGDEYGSVDELRADAATADGRARIRAALEHADVPGNARATLPEPTAAQRSQHDLQYIGLAFQNVSHFAEGGDAISTWESHHAQALTTALMGGLHGDAGAKQTAYLTEAFGEHFLTDAFSGGHVRTPRRDISEWYTTVLAPRVVDHFIAHLRDDLIDRLVAEANPQTNWPESVVRMRIGGRVRRNIDGALAAIPGGRPELIRWFGLAIAGAVSGSIHDMEGDRGVMVTSEAHPKPWRAFGDDKLSLSPVSRDQAEQAVLAAKEDVDIAFTIGQQEAQARAEVPESPPESVYFPFDSSTLTPEAAAGARSAARYLQYHPEAFVQLVGHTDPVGRDDYNDSLGQRRAGAVADVLAAAGVGAGRFETRSEGERSPVSTSPRMYNLDRRTDLIWEDRPTTDGSSGDAMSHDLALERAQATLAAAVGPPYTNVLRFVPHPVDASASTTGDENPPLPDWHWGALSTEVRAGIDAYINRQVGSRVTGMLAGRHELDDITESGVIVHPRVHVTAIITDLLAHPTDRLGDAFGEAPGPPAPAPAPGPAPAAP